MNWFKMLGYYQKRAFIGMIIWLTITLLLGILSKDWWWLARVGGSGLFTFILGIIFSKFL